MNRDVRLDGEDRCKLFAKGRNRLEDMTTMGVSAETVGKHPIVSTDVDRYALWITERRYELKFESILTPVTPRPSPPAAALKRMHDGKRQQSLQRGFQDGKPGNRVACPFTHRTPLM